MRRAGALVWSLAMPLAGAVLLAEEARARGPEPVVIVRPDAGTCVEAEALSSGIANAGAFLPSVVPEEVARQTASGAAVFRIEGTDGRLRIRGWLPRPPATSDGLEEWPVSWSERAPDLDREIVGHDCETATEAVVAFLVTSLSPGASGERDSEPPDLSPLRLGALLERAGRELTQRSGLTAGVLRTELGLTLIVEDVHASCRRGTWLDLRSEVPRMGQPVAKLERDVLDCLEERDLEEQRRGLALANHREPRGERFGLPQVTGSFVAAVGLLAGYAQLAQDDRNLAALSYTTVPAVVGGLSGYFAPEPWQEALWLAGYWSAVAGGSLVVAAQSGAAKPVLIGSALTAGTASSAALVLIDATGAADVSAWGIALPAMTGAALAFTGLFVEGRNQNSAGLAAIGSVAAVMPALWLMVRPGPYEGDATASNVAISLGGRGALVQLHGEL